MEIDNTSNETGLVPQYINTPENCDNPTLALKHNAVIRSAHTLSANAQKLTYIALSLLPFDLSTHEVSFSYPELCKALGLEKGGNSYELLKKTADECMRCVVHIEQEVIVRGKTKRSWEKFIWFSYSKFDEKTNTFVMLFSEKLAEYLAEIKLAYTKIPLKDVGKLQSRHAIRHYEMAKSYESMAGKYGNKPGEWSYERSLKDFRFILGVSEEEYPQTPELKRNVFEKPIKEINAAGLGLELKTQTIKSGRKITDIRIECKKTAPKLPVKRRKKTEASVSLPMPIQDNKTASRDDKDLTRLRERFPKEFAELYAEELKKKTDWLDSDSEFKKRAAEVMACMKLRERHGVVK
jgi:plasmid replication initiation protein